MEILSLLLVLAMLVGVYAIMLRPPTPASKRRRRGIGIDARKARDKDPVGTWALVAIAVVDVAGAGSATGLGTTFVLGVGLVLVLGLKALRPVIYTAVGALALLLAARDLGAGTGCGAGLTSMDRITVMLVIAAFLFSVGVARLLVAPVRASGAEARGGFLAIYGIVSLSIYGAQLQAMGALDGMPVWTYAAFAGFLITIAIGTAIQPVFATGALGAALAVVAVSTDTTAQCLDTTALAGVLLGAIGTVLLWATVIRPFASR